MIERSIEVFYKDDKKFGDLIVKEIILPVVSIDLLSKCFKINLNEDPCIYYDYKVTIEQILELKKYIDIDIDMYEYFLSCSSTE
ncbi:MAG: Unknown protein [uncultured Campylobacterales bacterium]|uniref:DUF7683 domain-containing protein n=1 Tax=uncultured Campylobacterales bacterium TaxID=352960 RepID=A0A6S6SSD5_9BACT|nr:MAG: Unknown protein [uncultured Campylobacterales bacterium]